MSINDVSTPFLFNIKFIERRCRYVKTVYLLATKSNSYIDIKLRFFQAAISQFRTEVENYEQSSYLEDFHHEVQHDMLMIGSLSKGDLAAHELKVKEDEEERKKQEV